MSTRAVVELDILWCTWKTGTGAALLSPAAAVLLSLRSGGSVAGKERKGSARPATAAVEQRCRCIFGSD